MLVNTASVATFDGQICQGAYAASKAGVAGLTLPVAGDLGQHRIRVAAIAPERARGFERQQDRTTEWCGLIIRAL